MKNRFSMVTYSTFFTRLFLSYRFQNNAVATQLVVTRIVNSLIYGVVQTIISSLRKTKKYEYIFKPRKYESVIYVVYSLCDCNLIVVQLWCNLNTILVRLQCNYTTAIIQTRVLLTIITVTHRKWCHEINVTKKKKMVKSSKTYSC